MAVCAECGASLVSDARFCSECGCPCKNYCPQCSKEIPVKAKFCSYCGYRLGADIGQGASGCSSGQNRSLIGGSGAVRAGGRNNAVPSNSEAELPEDVEQCYCEPSGRERSCEAVLLGIADISFNNAKYGVSCRQTFTYRYDFEPNDREPNWDQAMRVDKKMRLHPGSGMLPGRDVAKQLCQEQSYKTWQRAFVVWLSRNAVLELFYSPVLQAYSSANQTEGAFRDSLHQRAGQWREDRAREIRDKYALKVTRLQEKIDNAQREVERCEARERSEHASSMLDGVAGVIGLFGRSRVVSGVAREVSHMYNRQRYSHDMNARTDDARYRVASLESDMVELKAELDRELAAIPTADTLCRGDLETVRVSARKEDIDLQFFGVCWVPV